jgi:hypothetical protein
MIKHKDSRHKGIAINVVRPLVECDKVDDNDIMLFLSAPLILYRTRRSSLKNFYHASALSNEINLSFI